MSGKGDKRRNENTAAVEANWPTCWDARESDGVQQVCRTQGEDEGVDREAPSP